MPTPTLPVRTTRNQLVALGEDLINSWSYGSGSTDEHYADRKWEWNASEAGGNAANIYLKMGASALSATLYRVKQPREERYRRFALETVDRYFEEQQAPSGALWHNSLAQAASDNGGGFPMALANIATVVCALGEYRRWRDEILACLDFSTATGERTFYTNGNYNLAKAVAYWLGARVSGFAPSRVADFETTMAFLFTPNAVAGGSNWVGYGWVEDTAPSATDILGTGGKGYFSENTVSSAGTDVSALNRYDPEYVMLQADFASVGYLLSGDARFARAVNMTTNKLRDLWTAGTNQIDCSNGSRHAGVTYTRNFDCASTAIGAWMMGRSSLAADALIQLTLGSGLGLDSDYRAYRVITNGGIYRGAGIQVAPWLMAAHGRMF